MNVNVNALRSTHLLVGWLAGKLVTFFSVASTKKRPLPRGKVTKSKLATHDWLVIDIHEPLVFAQWLLGAFRE